MTSFPVCNPSRSARPPFMQRLCKFSHILRWFLSLQTRLVTAIKCRRSQANTAHTRQQAFKALTCEITCRRHSLPPLVWERNMYAVHSVQEGGKLLLCLRWMLENEYQVGERNAWNNGFKYPKSWQPPTLIADIRFWDCNCKRLSCSVGG